MKLVEESQFEETSDLQTLIEEDHHRGLQRGTKRAILSGAGAFSGNLTQQRNDPHLHLVPLSWILFVDGDPYGALKAGRNVIATQRQTSMT